MKSKRSKIVVIVLTITAVLVGIVMYSCRTCEYDNFEKYRSSGAFIYSITPDDPVNFKGVSRHIGFLGGTEIYSFRVTDEEYGEINQILVDTFGLDSTDEEDLLYGNAAYYGIKVRDIKRHTPDYELDDFCESELFELVTPVPVDEYTVIYFSPTGTGSVETGVFYNPNTSTIICYRAGTIH